MSNLQQYIVLSTNYHVGGDGRISYEIMTTPQINPNLTNCKTFMTLPSITPGDVFTVDLVNNEPIWVKQGHVPAFPGPNVLVDSLNDCPVCGQLLSKNDSFKWCISDSCLAKRHINIHKFLHLVNLPLNAIEKQAIDNLIGPKIRYVSDLFDLTEMDFINTDFPINKIDPKSIISLIKQIKMPFGAFLCSINLEPILFNNGYLNGPKISTDFQSFEAFMTWMYNARNDSNVINSNPYMSSNIFLLLNDYFTNRDNFMNMIKLINNGVFH